MAPMSDSRLIDIKFSVSGTDLGRLCCRKSAHEWAAGAPVPAGNTKHRPDWFSRP